MILVTGATGNVGREVVNLLLSGGEKVVAVTRNPAKAALPAITHGSRRYLALASGYTALYNLLGYPTGIVPVTRVRPSEESGRRPSLDQMERTARKVELGSAGLPVCLQVVARPWREHVALAVMHAIEQVVSTRNDYPGVAPI